jgi:hypothetical protein
VPRFVFDEELLLNYPVRAAIRTGLKTVTLRCFYFAFLFLNKIENSFGKAKTIKRIT